jgi:hypothetical protein
VRPSYHLDIRPEDVIAQSPYLLLRVKVASRQRAPICWLLFREEPLKRDTVQIFKRGSERFGSSSQAFQLLRHIIRPRKLALIFLDEDVAFGASTKKSLRVSPAFGAVVESKRTECLSDGGSPALYVVFYSLAQGRMSLSPRTGYASPCAIASACPRPAVFEVWPTGLNPTSFARLSPCQASRLRRDDPLDIAALKWVLADQRGRCIGR